MKRIFPFVLSLCIAHCALITPTYAVPASPQLLKQLLEQGDTARYEQMLNQSRIINNRRPQLGLRDKALQRAAQNGAHKQFGVTPLMASRGLLILANFSDKSFQSANTQAQMDSMMNAYNYTYNDATGSAAQYYSDQSLGAYRPHFDVVGPITLPKSVSYYGGNGSAGESGDLKLGDFVLHCCSIAAQIDGVNLANYDQDGDGEMDFVYIIYAGKGEADGGATSTLWPASWDMASAVAGGYTSLSTSASASKYTFDGVKIGSFAYSGELNGRTGARCGIGTPTHEFGHVLGLPDLYDTNYGSNYNNGNAKTPGDWDIMDGGSYNNDGKTPPSMSPWEKAFMGWITPVNPGNTPANLTLYANGTDNYNVYQINSSGNYQDYKTSGVCYLIENRQTTSKWDAYAPGHGMLIWKLNYNQSYWEANEPNSSYDWQSTQANTSGTVSYTVVSASGKTTGIGSSSDPFRQGTSSSWSGVSSRPLTEISESNGIVTCKYMGGAPDCTGYSISFNSTCATMTADNGYNADCVASGAGFDGSFTWTAGYVMDSIVVTMGGVRLSEESVDYIADESGISISAVTADVVINLYGHRDNSALENCDAYSWTASKTLKTGDNALGDWSWNIAMEGGSYLGYDSNKGAQFGSGTAAATKVSITTSEAATCLIDKVVVNASIASKGTGKLAVYIDGTQVGSTQSLTTSATNYTFSNTSSLVGNLELRYTNTAKALYLKSVNVSFVSITPSSVEQAEQQMAPSCKKVLIGGHLYLQRDGKTYSATGQLVK